MERTELSASEMGTQTIAEDTASKVLENELMVMEHLRKTENANLAAEMAELIATAASDRLASDTGTSSGPMDQDGIVREDKIDSFSSDDLPDLSSSPLSKDCAGNDHLPESWNHRFLRRKRYVVSQDGVPKYIEPTWQDAIEIAEAAAREFVRKCLYRFPSDTFSLLRSETLEALEDMDRCLITVTRRVKTFPAFWGVDHTETVFAIDQAYASF